MLGEWLSVKVDFVKIWYLFLDNNKVFLHLPFVQIPASLFCLSYGVIVLVQG
jgi:hypothetical protein